PCPRTTDQRRGTLTKQRKPAIIFDTANRSTTTAPAETRGGCKHSSPQCQRAAAAAVPQVPKRYEKSGLGPTTIPKKAALLRRALARLLRSRRRVNTLAPVKGTGPARA